MRSPPIGVFDSGIGGLSVLEALRAAMPHESFAYLGDTARLPYGTKSAQTVERYALRATAMLAARGVRAIVVACNTASAVALPALRRAHAPLPVFGVVGPGARAAARRSAAGRIAVIATASTVRGGAYARAILAARADARVLMRACSLLVPLAEEGWLDGPIVEAILREYLGDWIDDACAAAPDCLVLGCTHFPLFRPVIARLAGERMLIVDSAATTAAEVAAALADGRIEPGAGEARVQLLATDDAERFARIGGRFLGVPLVAGDVEVVDL